MALPNKIEWSFEMFDSLNTGYSIDRAVYYWKWFVYVGLEKIDSLDIFYLSDIDC